MDGEGDNFQDIVDGKFLSYLFSFLFYYLQISKTAMMKTFASNLQIKMRVTIDLITLLDVYKKFFSIKNLNQCAKISVLSTAWSLKLLRKTNFDILLSSRNIKQQ